MVQTIRQVDVPEANKRGLRALTVASLISLVCIFFALWSWMPSWKYLDRFPGLICILPFWLPYGFILLRLYGGRFKSGLALAIAMGCALFVPGALLLRFVIEWQTGWWVQCNLALALLMQPVLVAAAIWTYRSMPYAPDDPFKPWGSSTYGIVLFGLFWLVYSPLPRQIIYNENEAIDRLRDATNSNLHYAEKFDGFYLVSPSLWGPEGKSECDSDALSYALRRNPEDGYIFEYRSVFSDAPGRGGKVAKSYTITARPVAFRKTGIRSFFVDQSKLGLKWFQVRYIHIHYTSEDRPATTSDPGEDIELFTHRGFD
jgi:hypothetical protein